MADMLAFYSSSDQEAVFLDNIKGRYPVDTAHLHPGIVNLYSYLSTSKLRSEAAFSIEDVLNDLRQAEIVNEAIIQAASGHIRDPAKCPNFAAGSPKTSSEIEDWRYCAIADTYLLNRATLEREYLQAHIEYEVKGAHPDASVHADWLKHFVNLVSITNEAIRQAPNIDGMLPRALSPLEKARLPGLHIEAEDKFYWFSYLSLSSIMLGATDIGELAQACAVSRYYILEARNQLSSLANDKFRRSEDEKDHWPTEDLKVTFKLEQEGYLRALTHRIDASCLAEE